MGIMTPMYKPEYYDFLYEKSSRNRILITARTLFASLGYDNTSTALIARTAGTSESQLMKHFGGKAGLLESIFTEGWDQINKQLESCFESAPDLNGKLVCVPGVVFGVLDRDVELKTLVLLEAHRMRKAAVMGTDTGYGRFIDMIDAAVAHAKDNGEIRVATSARCIRSAVVGIVESGVRQQVLANRSNFPAAFTTEEYTHLMGLFLRTVSHGLSRGRPICTAN
jgi:AcrR family transcriptional regulator